MENRDRCPHCGALILSNEKFCGQCGVPLTGSADTAGTANTGEQTPANAALAGSSGWQPGTRPRTIEQLQDFCAYNEMPLERMRFFVGWEQGGRKSRPRTTRQNTERASKPRSSSSLVNSAFN